ncbi:hypothetical protein NQ318_009054 [Aromia moschata]|uniref:Uncharacterized protein n=1 Tax=Aromia moschata TaxID=1265417 RepID=A0AAV8YU33_9CUCU|nr:hypothetical protein NQ318_009054 [Aromia moschata]
MRAAYEDFREVLQDAPASKTVSIFVPVNWKRQSQTREWQIQIPSISSAIHTGNSQCGRAPPRLKFCLWFINHFNNNVDVFKVFFTDDTWFRLSGYVKSQNIDFGVQTILTFILKLHYTYKKLESGPL